MNPNEVNIRGAGTPEALLGIFELTDDTLRVCWSPAGKKRPRDFSVPQQSGRWLITLKRQIHE